MKNDVEYILCAAIKRVTPREGDCGYYEGQNDLRYIELGYRHHDIFNRFGKEVSRNPQDQGFYTSKGRFVDRYEGMEIAYNAGQVTEKKALSKDWYNIKMNINGETTTKEYWESLDTHKYNMLASEDLY